MVLARLRKEVVIGVPRTAGVLELKVVARWGRWSLIPRAVPDSFVIQPVDHPCSRF